MLGSRNGERMTHEQFCFWLEGFLDGGADMDLDVRCQIREKMQAIGSTVKAQPAADKPKTVQESASIQDRYLKGIGIAAPGLPGAAGPIGGWHSGGLVGSAHTLGLVDPHSMTVCTNAVNSAESALNSASAVTTLSAAARACE
jgi:hypothetical protein